VAVETASSCGADCGCGIGIAPCSRRGLFKEKSFFFLMTGKVRALFQFANFELVTIHFRWSDLWTCIVHERSTERKVRERKVHLYCASTLAVTPTLRLKFLYGPRRNGIVWQEDWQDPRS